MDVYIAATVDQGGNTVKAFRCFLAYIFCLLAHRLNAMVTCCLGLNDFVEKSSNPGLRDLINRELSLVSKFSCSFLAEDALMDTQRERDTKVLSRAAIMRSGMHAHSRVCLLYKIFLYSFETWYQDFVLILEYCKRIKAQRD